MPELPEVETIVRQLDKGLTGHLLGRVLLRRRDIVHGDPRPLSRLLPGKRVHRVHRRAKRVIIELEQSVQLVFHMGMTGRLVLADDHKPLDAHTHLRIALAETKRELRFCDPRRFGGVWCLAGHDRHVGRRLGPLGLEPLDMTPVAFRGVLNRRRQIKALLLDQTSIAGLGNIYCDESLHAVRIHPMARADEIDNAQAGQLLRAIKRILNQAIKHEGSTLQDYRTADGSKGGFQDHHRVYGREGESCRRCSATIQRMQVAGRSSFVCPSCQPFDG